MNLLLHMCCGPCSCYPVKKLRQEISELDEPAAANIISYGIEPYTKWCGAYGLPDIRENGEDSLALGRARWFGVTSITATETRTYPFRRPS